MRAIVLDLLFKYNLIKLAIDSYVPEIIIVAPIYSKIFSSVIATIGKNAKSTGTGNIFIGNIKTLNIIITAIICIYYNFYLLDLRR